MEKISDRLVWARKQKGLTQKQLAKKAGVAASTIGNVERGTSFTMRSILQIAKTLEVNPNWLAHGTGQPHDCIAPPINTVEMNAIIQAVIELMATTDEKGKLEILSNAQNIWELRESHLRTVGKSHSQNEIQRARHLELNKLSQGFNADFALRLKRDDQ